jgi:hypothetical protein
VAGGPSIPLILVQRMEAEPTPSATDHCAARRLELYCLSVGSSLVADAQFGPSAIVKSSCRIPDVRQWQQRVDLDFP